MLGFNVKVEAKAVKAAKADGVQVKLYSIVYELIDQVREAMLGLLEPVTRETVIGHAEVKQVFKLSRGRVAGCVRHRRPDPPQGPRPGPARRPAGLRRQDVHAAPLPGRGRGGPQGIECGIRLGEFNEYEEDDIIECYKLEKIAQTL